MGTRRHDATVGASMGTRRHSDIRGRRCACPARPKLPVRSGVGSGPRNVRSEVRKPTPERKKIRKIFQVWQVGPRKAWRSMPGATSSSPRRPRRRVPNLLAPRSAAQAWWSKCPRAWRRPLRPINSARLISGIERSSTPRPRSKSRSGASRSGPGGDLGEMPEANSPGVRSRPGRSSPKSAPNPGRSSPGSFRGPSGVLPGSLPDFRGPSGVPSGLPGSASGVPSGPRKRPRRRPPDPGRAPRRGRISLRTRSKSRRGAPGFRGPSGVPPRSGGPPRSRPEFLLERESFVKCTSTRVIKSKEREHYTRVFK